MSQDRKQLVSALLDRRGRTFAKELGIALENNTPSPLFRLLLFSLLASARISHESAMAAARALADKHWNTAQAMADSTWRERTDTLNAAGYARYDESTSRMLGETAELLLQRYDGDLRRLREQAERDPSRIRTLLEECKGIGEVGADMFCREAQTVWEELYPCTDKRSLKAARRLGLGDSAEQLAALTADGAELARLVSALIRVDLEDDYDEFESLS